MNSLRIQLAHAYENLSNLQLHQGAKWISEALIGLNITTEERIEPIPPQIIDSKDIAEMDMIFLARSYFACKEFDRAAHVLSSCKGSQATFLRLYATLMASDKRASAETEGSLKSPYDQTENTTRTFSRILEESSEFVKANGPNAFLSYLVGIIYARKKKYNLAQAALIESVHLYPWNWSAWQELCATLTTVDEASKLLTKLRKKFEKTQQVMFDFFEIVVQQQFYQSLQSVSTQLTSLEKKFPKFHFLKVQKFLFAYHQLDYFTAESIFDSLLTDDPLRLDDLDTYSNMLYVMEKKSKLAFLAQFASSVDKFRPETCLIVANYHSMKGEHEKAITYYRRALTLNKNCLSAWTLMGHEFVELKNSHAAIESYRRAVDTNPKDFRAWYGLGQAYEVLDMHMYALYYYQRATSLQPLDKRMWQALGGCYEKTGKLQEAVKSFEKALLIDSYPSEIPGEDLIVEPHIAFRLAILSEKLGIIRDTIKYMKMCLESEREWGISDETSKARLWLARHLLSQKKFSDAYGLVKDLHHSSAHDIEEARSIAREARNRMLK